MRRLSGFYCNRSVCPSSSFFCALSRAFPLSLVTSWNISYDFRCQNFRLKKPGFMAFHSPDIGITTRNFFDKSSRSTFYDTTNWVTHNIAVWESISVMKYMLKIRAQFLIFMTSKWGLSLSFSWLTCSIWGQRRGWLWGRGWRCRSWGHPRSRMCRTSSWPSEETKAEKWRGGLHWKSVVIHAWSSV